MEIKIKLLSRENILLKNKNQDKTKFDDLEINADSN